MPICSVQCNHNEHPGIANLQPKLCTSFCSVALANFQGILCLEILQTIIFFLDLYTAGTTSPDTIPHIRLWQSFFCLEL